MRYYLTDNIDVFATAGRNKFNFTSISLFWMFLQAFSINELLLKLWEQNCIIQKKLTRKKLDSKKSDSKIEMEKVYPNSSLERLFPNYNFYKNRKISEETQKAFQVGWLNIQIQKSK